MDRVIDLRSDTITLPTNEMKQAMVRAELGDDGYHEDPTVRELEALAAEMVGKEDAIFMPSGTMANVVAVKAHTHPGEEIIVESRAHVFTSELGAHATISGVQTRTLESLTGIPSPQDIAAAIREEDDLPRTGLICLENTHNRAGGVAFGPDVLASVADVAGRAKVPVHLDGARVFNAAIALGLDVRLIAAYADSVMFCLSKGLCAPVGSMLAGRRDFVERARLYRRMLGGTMRQAGVLAAAGLVGLKTMVSRLAEDHANARLLAESLVDMGYGINLSTVQTNIIRMSTDRFFESETAAVHAFERAGVLTGTQGRGHIRFVTHKDVGRTDIHEAVKRIRDVTPIR